MKFVNTPEPTYVETVEEALKWKEVFQSYEEVGYDTETTGLDIIKDRIKFFSMGSKDHRIAAPVRLLPVFKEILEDQKIAKRMTNAKFDMHMTANHDIAIKGIIIDTVCLDFLIDENRDGQHGLKETAKDYLGLRMASFKSVFGAAGSKKQEVKMITDIHDCLESNDRESAIHILVKLGKIATTDVDTLEGIKKIKRSMESDTPYSYTARTLLTIARKAGLCGKTTGKGGFIVDICTYMGIADEDDVNKDREAYSWVIDNDAIREDMHEVVLRGLTESLEVSSDPLDKLKLVVADYASLDAWASFMLVDVMSLRLMEEEIDLDSNTMYSLWDYYFDYYEPLIKASWKMEREGMKVDVEKCKQTEQSILTELEEVEIDIVRVMGKIINLNSTAQLREYFYRNVGNSWTDLNGNPVKFWSKGGAGGKKSPSTSKEALAWFAERGDTVAQLMEKRRILKTIQEFVHGFPKVADENGRIHTSFKIVGARTGRWASRDPNLQNIPSKGELGSKVRELFIAREGYTLIVCDYSQLEMRIMAHFAKETAMINAIKDGKDLHSMTAALAGGYSYDEVVAAKKKKDSGEKLTEEEKKLCEVRGHMKAVGFGLNYGIGATKLGAQLGLKIEEKKGKGGKIQESCPEGQKLIDDYYTAYPGILKYKQSVEDYVYRNSEVQTISGRFRRLPEVHSKEFWIRAKAKRQASNTIIQGSAGDIMNKAVINIAKDVDLKRLGVIPLLQIHDELVFECPDDPKTIQLAKTRVQELMEQAWDLDVPLEAEPGHGPSWEAAK